MPRNGHCVKSVQIRSCFWSGFSRIRTEYGENTTNAGKYGPEITPYLDTFQVVGAFVGHFLIAFFLDEQA